MEKSGSRASLLYFFLLTLLLLPRAIFEPKHFKNKSSS